MTPSEIVARTTAGCVSGRKQPPGAALVERAQTPALLVRGDATVLAANAAAAPLVAALERHHPHLRGMLLGAAAGGPAMARIVLDCPETQEPPPPFEVAVVPLSEEHLFVAARDVGFEESLTLALLRSRELYKDLMRCSADFGWETDAAGRLSYIGPAEVLGWPAASLLGETPASALGIAADEAAALFSARSPVRNAEVRARDRDGAPTILQVSALPVEDDGEWAGTRGVARDVTREHERARALQLDQARQALMTRIVVAIRGEVACEDILAVAIDALGNALRADGAWALGDGGAATRSGGADRLLAPARAALDLPASKAGADPLVEVGKPKQGMLRAVAAGDETLTGALVLARDVRAEPWRVHEVELVHGVAAHLALALKQAALIRRLRMLSTTDELTGLLNRRALMNELDRALRRQARSGTEAQFMLIDLDHFKPLNDTHGHAAGDAALAALGRLLRERSRAGDVAGRLGGDEFALWLEGTSRTGAVGKAQALQAAVRGLGGAGSRTGGPVLSLSIGIASVDPGRHSDPASLIELADRALYAAKRGGRARHVLAQATAEKRAC